MVLKAVKTSAVVKKQVLPARRLTRGIRVEQASLRTGEKAKSTAMATAWNAEAGWGARICGGVISGFLWTSGPSRLRRGRCSSPAGPGRTWTP